MIRQAISCDICGSEKKQTNHWFVAYDQGEELRVSGWNSRNRLRAGSKHLCGQTCLHKLVDEFMARILAVRLQPGAATEGEAEAPASVTTDTSLTSDAAYGEDESSARLLTPPEPALPMRPVLKPAAELLSMEGRIQTGTSAPLPEESARFASRNWRAEAWDRERERELRTVERRPDTAVRRRYN
ncbi:MAG: hypothetical protein P4K86_13340 [Terracidiphilus sp.]|nr:hypothetical protein [Terracidiphilus sp.]MDR3777204.1 hypothetical protein [Terracidiphilus sp.]